MEEEKKDGGLYDCWMIASILLLGVIIVGYMIYYFTTSNACELKCPLIVWANSKEGAGFGYNNVTEQLVIVQRTPEGLPNPHEVKYNISVPRACMEASDWNLTYNVNDVNVKTYKIDWVCLK